MGNSCSKRDLAKIKKIALAVREKIQTWLRSNKDNLSGEISCNDLQGACAISSYILCKSLQKAGYNPSLILGSNDDGDHVWLELDQYIIDITATQFKFPEKVVIRKLDNVPGYLEDFDVTKKDNLVLEDFQHWGAQNPFRYSEELDQLII